MMRAEMERSGGVGLAAQPDFGPTRTGDIPHSHADISKARARLGYAPTHDVLQGLRAALPWYRAAFAPPVPVAAGLS
jgi:nucleoside-diphosphate-sugar epimerase